MLVGNVLEELNEIADEKPTVVSLYLDVDGSKLTTRDDIDRSAGQLLRKAHREMEGGFLLSHEEHKLIDEDIRKITEWLQRSFDRHGSRGIAVFASSKQGVFKTLPLPQAVTSSVHIDKHAHLGELVKILDRGDRYCVLLANKETVRIFSYAGGEITEETSIFEEVPNKHQKGGWSQSRYQRHHGDHVHRHLRRVADETFRFFKANGFDHLIVATTEEVEQELERTLHSYLRERINAHVNLDVSAPVSKVQEAARQIEAADRARQEEELLRKLETQVDSGNLGVSGLGQVLSALSESRVGTLLIREGARIAGSRCMQCNHLSAEEGLDQCPVCGSMMSKNVDLLDFLIEEALDQSCEVHFIGKDATSWALADVAGVLRYDFAVLAR